MPPKNKGGGNKAKPAQPAAQEATPKKPQTVREQAWEVYYATNPYEKAHEELGLNGMTAADRQAYVNKQFLKIYKVNTLPNKAHKELWKQINEASVPLRSAHRPDDSWWGTDKNGRSLGDYSPEEYEVYDEKRARLIDLKAESEEFVRIWDRAKIGHVVRIGDTTKTYTCTAEDVEAEIGRRREMAALRKELYGIKMDPYVLDPEWDDVVPIPQVEPEGALATIAYPDEYAESMSYLRAVMAAKEYSPRCLRLTERIISLNPAHYTVWLYRFSILSTLNISIPDELAWLNQVALTHIKNYQIWNHRQHLIDHHYPSIVTSPSDVAALAASERAFLEEMLSLDTKNYHVWSYRQYLVRKLGLWSADPEELQAAGARIDEDVRNNSAWSHRFFLVFSDPAHATPDSHATAHDPKIPSDIIDRELRYAMDKIALAPQNQSPWNYLRGVLVKGGREFGSAREFAEGFVDALGEGEDKERVRSSHALDLLADVYKEAGETERARLVLTRLAERWDRIRKGYWQYRASLLGSS
ncbi:hypothetical protein M426DRAFT_319209 [Hypoxylon sp. CI-4A]|nr:hypothetical protein M426DRAFT_319209 [Hypoxylon sp. CI-4A]